MGYPFSTGVSHRVLPITAADDFDDCIDKYGRDANCHYLRTLIVCYQLSVANYVAD